MQRLSNNFRPQFTDEEAITVFLWGILQRRFEIKAIYAYTSMHLADWFPKLPSYQALDRRLGELSPVFSALAERFMTDRAPEGVDMNMLLMDSMPILLAKGSRSTNAKVAQELCAKTYNASRKEWLIYASEASCHDLPIARQTLERNAFRGFFLLGDKAYADATWKAELQRKNIQLLTPTKLLRGQSPSFPGGDAHDTAISRARQPIESFFNWLHEKTGIQIASKVRSLKGLLLHIFGRLAAALFSLRVNP